MKTGSHHHQIGMDYQLMSFNVISVDSNDSHFEFRVNQELTKSHMDFAVSSLDSSSRKTWI